MFMHNNITTFLHVVAVVVLVVVVAVVVLVVVVADAERRGEKGKRSKYEEVLIKGNNLNESSHNFQSCCWFQLGCKTLSISCH